MHFFEQIWLNPHFKTQKRNKNGLGCGFNRNFWKNVVLKPHAKFFDPLSTRYNGLFSKIKTTHTTPPGPPYNISVEDQTTQDTIKKLRKDFRGAQEEAQP